MKKEIISELKKFNREQGVAFLSKKDFLKVIDLEIEWCGCTRERPREMTIGDRTRQRLTHKSKRATTISPGNY